MGSPPLEEPMPRQGSLPPHLQQQGYMRARTATPPPMSNGLPYHQRQNTPQPQLISRPGSSQAIRRTSTNLGPSHLQQVSQAPPGSNGYTYMRSTPPMHNYQAARGMPAAPHHGPQASGTQQYYNQLQQANQVQQAYIQDQRRQSVPPAFPQHDRQPQNPQHNMPSPPQPDQQRTQDDQSNRLQKPAAAKSRSIFTPIDDSRSLLAQHWGTGRANAESKPDVKREIGNHSRSNTLENVPQEQSGPRSPPTRSDKDAHAHRRASSTSLLPPLRTDSAAGAKRPKLKVHIPEEQSEPESATEESSKEQSGSGNRAETPAKNSTEASHSSGTGVVLPPPSPSASAILSAGASGPPNPFARPLPPQGAQQHNSAAFDRNRNDSIDTPMSALPSRFVADGLLPSPSSFYPEWNFGRSGGESANILPSPLNFQTPVISGPSFAKDDESDKKRKSPEGDAQESSNLKRVKT